MVSFFIFSQKFFQIPKELKIQIRTIGLYIKL